MSNKIVNQNTSPLSVLVTEGILMAIALGLSAKEAASFIQRTFNLDSLSVDTVYKTAEANRGRIEELRKEKYGNEIAVIEDKMRLIIDGITGEKVNKAQLAQLTTAFGTLFDKRALSRGEATQIVSGGAAALDNLSELPTEELVKKLAERGKKNTEQQDAQGARARIRNRRTHV